MTNSDDPPEAAAEGTPFGHYTRLGRLGAGGMGDVFLARDERLGRDVALKMLPKALARDGEQMQRFRREALTLASLNHPNIAIIYGFEEDPATGAVAIVLERIEGESLGERLRQGAPPFTEALRVCAQIAEALEVAHERGIVHRDLKPGNVMLAPRGLVKVLDFGLARQFEPGAAAPAASAASAPATGGSMPSSAVWTLPPPERSVPPSASDADATIVVRPPEDDPTIVARASDLEETIAGAPRDLDEDATIAGTASPLTIEGVASGTPGYMSPEQVRGAHQDHRTDIFAFGCVLYECVSGRQAFTGRTPMERMANAIDREADLAALPAHTPPPIRDLIARCLEKDPARRLDEIRVARHTLEDALGIRRAAALRAGEAAAIPSNLPTPATSFVGRDRERAEALERLGATRLLTLAGMGGSGKTRLAIEVARAVSEAYPDGVWFVDLSAQQKVERVPEALAAAVGVVEDPGVPIERTLVTHFRERRALIVLDNCEDLLAAVAGLVTQMLGACPGLRLIATSREPLAVAGEVVLAVPPLAVPETGAADTAALAASDAVRLFVQRAGAVRPDFALTAENAGVVVEICRRLDGIPLAIELAAARVRLLSPAQIRDRLGDRFKLLTAGSGGTGGRHQTLRATVQWSVDQLNPEERELFDMFGVFVSPWTLTSAVEIAGGRDEFEVLDAMSRLADRSLLVVQPAGSGDSRYRYLETVRVFALESLIAAGDPAPVRDRHLRHFAGVAESAPASQASADQKRWLDQLEREHDDLLAAHDWCGAGGGPERAVIDLKMVGALWRFWSAKGHYALARRTLNEALSRPGAGDPGAERAAALVRAGAFALHEGDHDAARPQIEEALAISRAIGDKKGVARCLLGLSTIAVFGGDLAGARARSLESLAAYREIGQTSGATQSLHNLGYAALRMGDLDEARARLEEALAMAGQAGDERMMTLTLAELATVSIRLGDTDAARARLASSLQMARALDARREPAYAIEGVADLAGTSGDPRTAAWMLGAAEGLRAALGSFLSTSERAEQKALLDRLTAAAGAGAVAEAMAAGRREPFEQAAPRALEWLEGAAQPGPGD
jgi:predicted ATPase/serine/threonine protein kinase